MKTRREEKQKSMPQILLDAINADMRESRQVINRCYDILRKRPSPVFQRLLDIERDYLAYLESEHKKMRDFYEREKQNRNVS